MHNLQQRKDDEETAILTPMQQARYLMYLMSLIKEARSIKSGTGGPGGQSRPGGRRVGPGVWGGPGAWGCQPCGLPRSRFPVRLSKTGPGAGDPSPPPGEQFENLKNRQVTRGHAGLLPVFLSPYLPNPDEAIYNERAAGVVELVDAGDSKSPEGNLVPVRVRPPAP